MALVQGLPKCFLFDMGNVVIRFSHERMCRQVAEVVGWTPAQVRGWLFDSGVLDQFERGQVTSHAVVERIRDATGRKIAADPFWHAVNDIFEPNASLWPVLRMLRSAGHRLVLLSNTCEQHFAFVRRAYPILSVFDAYTLSYEVGAMKPERAIFDRAISLAEVSADACFYSDDIERFIVAAGGFGIAGAVFTTTEAFLENLESRYFGRA